MLKAHRIPNQLPGEEVIRIMRRDYFIMFKRIILFVILLSLLLVFMFAFYSFDPTITSSLYFPAIVLAGACYFLFIWLFFFFSFIDYYLDVWIITNERIINIEQNGFFSRTISEERLFRIQDVTSEVKGVLPTVFKYGNVIVQTAAEKNRFNFEQVSAPDEVRDIIIRLAEADRERQSSEIKAETVGIL
ncbi:PH domain-containing protein [Candidatus Falkowbacteria bacterium]|nr:PH domain-containing protein [Candidatus Falkowbacteria bacterium]